MYTAIVRRGTCDVLLRGPWLCRQVLFWKARANSWKSKFHRDIRVVIIQLI